MLLGERKWTKEVGFRPLGRARWADPVLFPVKPLICCLAELALNSVVPAGLLCSLQVWSPRGCCGGRFQRVAQLLVPSLWTLPPPFRRYWRHGRRAQAWLSRCLCFWHDWPLGLDELGGQIKALVWLFLLCLFVQRPSRVTLWRLMDPIILCCGSCLGLCRMFSRNLGLYPADPSNTTPPPGL